MEEQIFQLKQEEYRKIHTQWRKIHYYILVSIVIITAIVEGIMFFVVRKMNMIMCTIPEYLWKYLLFPVLVNTLILLVTRYLLHKKNISDIAKNYLISLAVVGIIFLISVVHGGFIAVYMLWILPIMLTTIYAKIRLTTVTTLVSLFAHEISAFYIQWNPEKITDILYPVNITLFLFLTICVYAISVVIIKWEEKKQDAVLEKEMERQTLRRQIRRDHLTGLYNRMGLREQFTRFDEENVEQYYFAMLDIDRFKMVNDTLGHDVGDRILQLLGRILLSMETDSFIPFRYGGDEFSIMAYGISLEELVERCKEIQRQYEENLPEGIKEKGCSISVGIAQSIKGLTPSDVIKDADYALYQTKYTEKGGILIYQSKTEPW